jgi:hypothetical protein
MDREHSSFKRGHVEPWLDKEQAGNVRSCGKIHIFGEINPETASQLYTHAILDSSLTSQTSVKFALKGCYKIGGAKLSVQIATTSSYVSGRKALKTIGFFKKARCPQSLVAASYFWPLLARAPFGQEHSTSFAAALWIVAVY